MNISKLGELKKIIGKLITDNMSRDFPKTIIYNRGLDHPKFKITFEEFDEDFFIDSKGVKWVKVIEDLKVDEHDTKYDTKTDTKSYTFKK